MGNVKERLDLYWNTADWLITFGMRALKTKPRLKEVKLFSNHNNRDNKKTFEESLKKTVSMSTVDCLHLDYIKLLD